MTTNTQSRSQLGPKAADDSSWSQPRHEVAIVPVEKLRSGRTSSACSSRGAPSSPPDYVVGREGEDCRGRRPDCLLTHKRQPKWLCAEVPSPQQAGTHAHTHTRGHRAGGRGAGPGESLKRLHLAVTISWGCRKLLTAPT